MEVTTLQPVLHTMTAAPEERVGEVGIGITDSLIDHPTPQEQNSKNLIQV